MFVYFIVAGEFVKVGKAVNPGLRMKELQTGCPMKMRLHATLDCGSDRLALIQERYIHHLFRKHRMRGEWFKWTREMEGYIRNSKKEIERDGLLAGQYDAMLDAHYLAALDRDA